jgi:hypothetical protein
LETETVSVVTTVIWDVHGVGGGGGGTEEMLREERWEKRRKKEWELRELDGREDSEELESTEWGLGKCPPPRPYTLDNSPNTCE